MIGHKELFVDLRDHFPPDLIYERELLICKLQRKRIANGIQEDTGHVCSQTFIEI